MRVSWALHSGPPPYQNRRPTPRQSHSLLPSTITPRHRAPGRRVRGPAQHPQAEARIDESRGPIPSPRILRERRKMCREGKPGPNASYLPDLPRHHHLLLHSSPHPTRICDLKLPTKKRLVKSQQPTRSRRSVRAMSTLSLVEHRSIQMSTDLSLHTTIPERKSPRSADVV
jgi:hypothetical protein